MAGVRPVLHGFLLLFGWFGFAFVFNTSFQIAFFCTSEVYENPLVLTNLTDDCIAA